MFCCDLEPIVVPSPEAKRLNTLLKFIACGHILFAILYFVGGTYFALGFAELVFAFVIYLTYSTYYYFYIAIYTWLLALCCIIPIINIGSFIQYSNKFFDELEWKYIYMLIVFSMILIFYGFALYITYRSYKEFKALFMVLFEEVNLQ